MKGEVSLDGRSGSYYQEAQPYVPNTQRPRGTKTFNNNGAGSKPTIPNPAIEPFFSFFLYYSSEGPRENKKDNDNFTFIIIHLTSFFSSLLMALPYFSPPGLFYFFFLE